MRRERGTTRIATSSDAKRLFRTRPLTPKSTQSKIGSARGKAKTRVADASVHTNAARANELVVCNRRALKLSQRDAPNSGRKSVSLWCRNRLQSTREASRTAPSQRARDRRLQQSL